tara:strand:- start:3686 stop:5044 length:1359 start_codon:yes stop_codon:yes gene_type:complete
MSTTSESYDQRKDNRELKDFDGDYGYPFLGKTISLVKDPYILMQDHYDKYGPVSRMAFVRGQRSLLMLGPEYNQPILFDRDRNFSSKTGYAGSLGHFYEEGLLLKDFDEHKKLRRATQPAFKTDSLKDYVRMVQPIQESHIDKLPTNEEISLFPLVKETLLDVASNVFVGINASDKEAKELSKNFIKVSDGLITPLPYPIPFSKYWKGQKAKLKLKAFFEEKINVRRDSDNPDIFTQVTKAKTEEDEYLTNQEISGHMSFLLFAAHDTTTSTLLNLMFYLGKNKNWQDRLREEVLSINKKELDYEDLNSMTDTELAFKETLRLHPSVMMLTRRNIDKTEIEGHKIPADTILTLSPSFVHRMPEWWDDPLKFDPERFSDSRAEDKRHPFSYIPFGGGAHKCIGMHFALLNLRIFIFQTLKKYSIEIDEDYNPYFQSFPMPMPSDGLKVKLKKL